MATQMDGKIPIRLVIYKKIVQGDLSKFTATSNITPSGGGARDLRFSPADKFYPKFEKMFPTKLKHNILTGKFSWDGHSQTEVQVHPPTHQRPNEVRISKIHECFPKNFIPHNADDCILILVLDNQGLVWPYFTSEYSLIHQNWHEMIRSSIIDGLNAKRNKRTTAMGYIDFETGDVYTNGN